VSNTIEEQAMPNIIKKQEIIIYETPPSQGMS
jgi:hypothetical protein